MDLGTVASTRASTDGKFTEADITDWSEGEAELWRRGNVSVGFRVSREMERVCCHWLGDLANDVGTSVETKRVVVGIDGEEDVEFDFTNSCLRSALLPTLLARSITIFNFIFYLNC